jgi:alpha-mannosidase
MKKTRCYYIGNTHIDHTWLWNWTEGYDEVKASYTAALERMDEFPEFVFTCSATLHYRWLEENEPKFFAQIQRRVKEGRWQLAGGWVVQSDNNAPNGESFCREGLYGQRYFRSRFGKLARTGYCVDSFGHNAQLPQILRLQGMDGWLHFRPDHNELKLPAGPYRWVGIDGSEVVACRPPGWYCTVSGGFAKRMEEGVREHAKAYPEVLCFYGVGDHGGGPTIADLESIRAYRRKHPEYEYRYGGLDEFYRRAERRDLPTVKGEIQYAYRGCYTSHSAIKSLNRRCEARLAMAEWAAALASMTQGAPYPVEEAARAWEDVLANQFHDVMGGTCTRVAMEESVFRYAGVMEAADRIRHFGFKHVTDAFNRRAPRPYKESLAICVGNSLSWDRRDPVEFCPFAPGRDISSPGVVDGAGQAVEFQKIAHAFGAAGVENSMLMTPEVPAGGAAIFHVVDQPEAVPVKTDLKATPDALENSRWRLRLDAKTGTIRSLMDKKHGVEIVPRRKRADDLLVIKDLGDTWGTKRDEFRDVVGSFTNARVRLLERGPLRARLEVRRRYKLCTAYELISLYRDLDYVDFQLEVIWNDELKTAKMAFPLALSNARSLYEIPYGAIKRPANGEEYPMQNWVLVRGRAKTKGGGNVPYSVGIAADTVGAADVLAGPTGAELRLTLLRSPVYGYYSVDDIVSTPDRPIIDKGTTRQVRYRLVAGRGDLGMPEHGAAVAQPLQVAFEGAQPGKTTRPFSLVRCEPKSVHLAALKGAEDGRGFVARLVETRGKETRATLKGPRGFRTIRTTLRPFEIQSWRWASGKAPVLCNLLEDPVRRKSKSK